MNKTRFALLGILLLILGTASLVRAQTVELLAGNVLNGAVNGALLGGATMGLQNSNDFEPVQVGVGLGTLYGVGAGVYNVSTVSIGNQFYISGTFNDGTNSSIIVLLDTFYGATAGALISTSISLIAKNSIIEGLQYGTSAGAWLGFGFGLVDAFALSRQYHTEPATGSLSGQVSGLIRYTVPDKSLSLSLVNPTVIARKHVSPNRLGMDYFLGVDVLNVNISL